MNFSEILKDVDTWTWKVDKKELLCKNDDHNVLVKIEEEGGILKGKLLDMPMELLGEISKLKNGEKIIEKIVSNAQNAFSINRATSA